MASINRTQHSPIHTPLTSTPQPVSSSPMASYRPKNTMQDPLHQLDILLHIAPYLSLHDLYLCTLVSSFWYKAFNPVLWRAVSISESRHEPDFLTDLSRNLRWVQSLQWNYTEWWELHHVARERYPVGSPSPSRTPSPRPTILPNRADIAQMAEPEDAQSRAHAQHPCHPRSLLSSSSSKMPSLPGTTAPTATPPTLGTTPRRCSYTGRPIYLAPTPISFPTSTALQALGFENACALQSLVLDGPFELIPLLTTLRQLVPEKQCLRRLSLKNTNCMRREVVPIDLLLRVSPWLEHCSIRTNAQIQTTPVAITTTTTTPATTRAVTATPNTTFGNRSGAQTQSKEDILRAHDNPNHELDNNDDLGAKKSVINPRLPMPLVRLGSLELDIRAMTAVQLMDILIQCPNLESLAITDYGQISPIQDFCNSYGISPSSRTGVAVESSTPSSFARNDSSELQPKRVALSATSTPYCSPSFFSHGPYSPPSCNKDKVDPRDDGRFLAQIALEADHYNNDRLKRLVDSLPTFVHRNVESVRLGDVALTFLTHRCGQQLTTLELTQSHSGKIQSRTLQTFLRSATGLKHLRTKGGVTLQVEDMLDSANHAWVPWACTGLETLSIAFGVAGPSTLSPLPPLLYNSSPVAQGHTDHLLTGNLVQSSSNSNSNSSSGILESSNGSIIHHAAAGAGGASMSSHNAWAERMVYKQLSLLTRIRVLDIRQSFLRLQTGTGIELLSSLRQLREFSIAGSDAGQVTVTKEMDAWFRQNWPSIDKIVVASRACALNTTGVTLPSRLLPMTGPVGPAIGANGDRRHSC